MVPDFALRIQSMIRSMQEVILPAIPKERQLALDQANILIGNLRIMAEQQDRVFQYLLVELREYAALVNVLIADAQGLDVTEAAVARARSAIETALPVTQSKIPRQDALAALVKSLKQAADDLLGAANEDGTPVFRKAAGAHVMRQSQAQVIRERVWLRAAGFELEPGALPSLDETLR
jgi:hypothetical protein